MKHILLIVALAAACSAASMYMTVTPDSHLVIVNAARDTLWKSSDVVQFDSALVAGSAYSLVGGTIDQKARDTANAALAKDSVTAATRATLAANATLFKGRDTADFDDAKTLQTKDTNTIHVYPGRDSAAAQKGDSGLFKKVDISPVFALADTGRTLKITNSAGQGTATQYGTGLSDITWSCTKYSGHKTADTFFVAVQYAGVGGDTLKWKQGRTGTYAKWIVSAGTKKAMAVSCTLAVAAATGHTLGDSWLLPVSAPWPLQVKLADGTTAGGIQPDGAVQWGYGNTGSGNYATVGGGIGNTASGTNYATVGGGYGNTSSQNSAVVAGGYGNIAGNTYATVGGGVSNSNTGDQSVIGGGSGNTLAAKNATIGGGVSNSIPSVALGAIVPGGYANVDSAPYSALLGDSLRAKATDSFSFGTGAGAGHGRLVSPGKRCVWFGVDYINTVMWAGDSLVAQPGVDLIVHGPAKIDSLLTANWFIVGGGDTLGKMVGFDAGDSVMLFITRHGAHADTWKMRK